MTENGQRAEIAAHAERWMVYTLGHSNHPIATVLAWLQRHGITEVADVRSRPQSRFCPQYNRLRLQASLARAGIRYVHLQGLGARSDNPAAQRDGRVDWELIVNEPAFMSDLQTLHQELQRNRVALLCAEHDPFACHRAMLLGPILKDRAIDSYHILKNGDIETHEQLEQRLLAQYHMDDQNIFYEHSARLREAYRRHGEKLVYRLPISTPR